MFRKIFIAAVIFFMSASVAEAGVWQPELRVGILSGVKQVTLKVSAPCIMIDASTNKTITEIPADRSFVLNFSRLKSEATEIRPEKIPIKDLQTSIDGQNYFGGVRLNKGKDFLTVINLAPLEEYLRGVLPREMSPSYPLEALKAQAVAARSFALKNRGKHEAEGFDLCTSTHCQIFIGAKVSEITDKAIDDTHGEVLVYNNKLADTNFHADSGGMTESVVNVWGKDTPYLVAVKEIIQLSEPWTVKVTTKDFSSRFGEGFGEVKEIKLSKLTVGKEEDDRTPSGRVKFAQVVSSKKTLKLAGNELRRKFSLPSTLFDMKIDGKEIIFAGYGRGHGVGMAQKGAKFYAEDGWSYEKILEHYYSGTKLKKLY